jgi:phage terminase small subunit
LIANRGGRQPPEIDPLLFPVASATPPRHPDANACAVWTEYANLLVSRGLLSRGDAAKFELFCLACGRARQIDRAIRAAGGINAETAKLTVAEVKYMQLADKLGALFGLDPIARTRLNVHPPQTRDWLDALTGDDDSPIQCR